MADAVVNINILGGVAECDSQQSKVAQCACMSTAGLPCKLWRFSKNRP